MKEFTQPETEKILIETKILTDSGKSEIELEELFDTPSNQITLS